MSGQWTGGAANRRWGHPGSRERNVPGDRDRGIRLYRQLAYERFWCETCHGFHPLHEHRNCRRKARKGSGVTDTQVA